MVNNAAGNVKAKFTHGSGIDEPLAIKKGANIYYYHADGLGSIVALTDTTGSVVQTYSYDSFGHMTKTTDVSQPYTYTGREHDPETGLYFYRARYYDPHAGRFLTRDPISFAGGINQYAYVLNNPVGYRDPFGLLFWISGPGGLGATIGGAAGGAVGSIAGTALGSQIGMDIGFAIGGALGLGGGPLGSLGGAIAGEFVGGWVGGAVGGLIGGYLGSSIGSYFDNPCAGQLNCGEPTPPVAEQSCQ